MLGVEKKKGEEKKKNLRGGPTRLKIELERENKRRPLCPDKTLLTKVLEGGPTHPEANTYIV